LPFPTANLAYEKSRPFEWARLFEGQSLAAMQSLRRKNLTRPRAICWLLAMTVGRSYAEMPPTLATSKNRSTIQGRFAAFDHFIRRYK
jgi:hypothetical protein